MSTGLQPNAAALMPIEHYAVLQSSPEDLRDILTANVGTGGMSDMDLDRLRVPAGGGTTWEVPALTGNEPAKSVEGVIVAWHDARAYWSRGLEQSGGGSPPDCSSTDGVTGHGAPGGSCAKCPMAEFGSAKKDEKAGRGQACKLSKLLFLVRPSDMLPLVIVTPPGSLRNIKRYMLRLSSQAVPIYAVVTALELTPTTNRDGIKFGMITPRFVGRVTPETAERLKAYGEIVGRVFSRVGIQPADVVGDGPEE